MAGMRPRQILLYSMYEDDIATGEWIASSHCPPHIWVQGSGRTMSYVGEVQDAGSKSRGSQSDLYLTLQDDVFETREWSRSS